VKQKGFWAKNRHQSIECQNSAHPNSFWQAILLILCLLFPSDRKKGSKLLLTREQVCAVAQPGIVDNTSENTPNDNHIVVTATSDLDGRICRIFRHRNGNWAAGEFGLRPTPP